MNTVQNVEPATPESVWAILRELAVSQADTDRRMKETDRQIKENDRILSEKIAETDRILSEKQAETDRILSEKQAETDRQMKETDRQMKETGRRMDKIFSKMSSWDYNHGQFAEEYFLNSFEQGHTNFFGERFDYMMKNRGGVEIEDEYDIVLVNGQYVGIVEVKFKAHENDIPKVLRKVDTFRINFPKFQNHKVYLGLASMAFYPEVEETCKKQGIAVIKQVGETLVIHDEHLKAF